MNLAELIKEKKGTVIDVRSRGEFSGGHAEGAVNIPLQEIAGRMEELKSLKMPLILCCASGGRSAQAYDYLSKTGVECYNAGTWLDVNYYQSQTV